MSIEANFDIPFVAALALREKQIQQNYRPIIAVHKWFARRPGALFRALLLAEFGKESIRNLYYRSNDLGALLIADPFMGGGTPLIEANRLGCNVVGFDINPMATWIVREEIEHLDLDAYRKESTSLLKSLANSIGRLYKTDCPLYQDKQVPVKYFLWVKTRRCDECDNTFDLFPGYLIAEDARHPKNVFVCSKCGDLNEVADRKVTGSCTGCKEPLVYDGPAKRGHADCPSCGHTNPYPAQGGGPPTHRLFAIEYYNPKRKSKHAGRFFKKPDANDLENVRLAEEMFRSLGSQFVPNDAIPEGDETNRLHRWGYGAYRDLFSSRQLLGLELSCRYIAGIRNGRVRSALATNLSDLLRYQNMLCRYDTMALKSLDIFSVHGFPVGLVQCESNFLGITNGNGLGVGSGGWSNIVEKFFRAKKYCDEPFEVRHVAGKKTIVPTLGEWIGERNKSHTPRSVRIECISSADARLDDASLDAVFTDPPYFGNVQYGELMDFCYTWLRKLAPSDTNGFAGASGRSINELTGNATQSRGISHFAEGLAAIYSVAAKALKPNAPLAFTFHHNKIAAYTAVGMAILDAGLVCTASIPCPAEMSGSIHISGTCSSITDTVFVCRKSLGTDHRTLKQAAEEDIVALAESGMRVQLGDVRCVVMGHATRLAVVALHPGWNYMLPTAEKLELIGGAIENVDELLASLPLESSGQKRPGAAHNRGTIRTVRPHAFDRHLGRTAKAAGNLGSSI